VHFPIALITLTSFLDVLYCGLTSPVTAPPLRSFLKSLDLKIDPNAIPPLSHYTNILALISAIPTIFTGALELLPLIKRDGLTSTKVRTGFAHAALNDLAVFASAYNWWVRKSMDNYTPNTMNLAISGMFILPVALFAANLGGTLVYRHGVGVGRPTNKENRERKTQ
jgi:uncharacterized membrane protein